MAASPPDNQSAGRVSLDDVVRGIIREELARTTPAVPPSVAPAPSRREAWLLLLIVVNAGLVLALMPQLDGPVQQFVSTFTALGGSVCAVGYMWWRQRLETILTSRGFVAANATLLAGLASIHIGRSVPLAPILVDPPDALVAVDGRAINPIEGSVPGRVTLRRHTIEVRPRSTWAKTARGPEKFDLDVSSFLRAMVSGPRTYPLLCEVAVAVEPDDLPVAVAIRRCDPKVSTRCVPNDLSREHAAALSKGNTPGFKTLIDRHGFSIEPAVISQFTIPVGDYEVTASKIGCDTHVRRWSVDARTCSDVAVEKLKCASS